MSDLIPNLNLYGDPQQAFPFYIYSKDGKICRENITDWALKAFQTHCGDDSISKWDIFYYNYGILHHPDYRDKYREDLKRSLPRISLAEDFWGVFGGWQAVSGSPYQLRIRSEIHRTNAKGNTEYAFRFMR